MGLASNFEKITPGENRRVNGTALIHGKSVKMPANLFGGLGSISALIKYLGGGGMPGQKQTIARLHKEVRYVNRPI